MKSDLISLKKVKQLYILIKQNINYISLDLKFIQVVNLILKDMLIILLSYFYILILVKNYLITSGIVFLNKYIKKII